MNNMTIRRTSATGRWLLPLFLFAMLLRTTVGLATSNHEYGPDEYVTIAKGISPNGTYAITAHGEGDMGYDHFHIYLTNAVRGKKIGPLEEIVEPLDTGADAFCAKWSDDQLACYNWEVWKNASSAPPSSKPNAWHSWMSWTGAGEASPSPSVDGP